MDRKLLQVNKVLESVAMKTEQGLNTDEEITHRH